MKRLFAFTLSALLLCPMTSFAAQTDEAKAVYQEMMDTTQTMNDMNAYYDMNIKMSDGTDSLDMRMEMNARMQNLTNPSDLRYQVFTRATLPDGQQTEYSMYYLDGYTYLDMMGQKIKYPVPFDQALTDAMSASELIGTTTDFYKDLTVRTEGDLRILSYSFDDAKMNDYIKMFLGAVGVDSLYNGLNLSISNINGEYTINPEGYFTKMTMNMDMAMTIEGQTLNASVVADIGIADPGQPVEITTPNPGEYTETSQPVS